MIRKLSQQIIVDEEVMSKTYKKAGIICLFLSCIIFFHEYDIMWNVCGALLFADMLAFAAITIIKDCKYYSPHCFFYFIFLWGISTLGISLLPIIGGSFLAFLCWLA